MADLAYSYHNFIFPFIWQNSAENYKGPCFEEIKNNFENTHVWANDDLDDWYEIKLNEKEIQADHLNVNHLKYATYQYYQPAIRNAIFGKGNKDNKLEVVQSYYFTPIKKGDGINDKRARYIIRKEIKVGENEYCLKEYHLNLSDIKIINDYGRRITLPFIPKSNDKDDRIGSLCADSISIYWDGMGDDICHNFREQIININSSKKKADLNHIANFIINILNYSIGDDNKNLKKFTTNKKDKDKEWYIQPALDDRMFVMCAVNNNFQKIFKVEPSCITPAEYINHLNNNSLYGSGNRGCTYEPIEKSLYEFIYCDPPGNCTCYFAPMRQQLIKEHLYCRWVAPEFGTLYTVAAQAFNCVSDYYLILNYFRTEYYEMACLVLVQRASLRVMQNKASSLSSDIEKDENTVDMEKRKQIANLQEKLIAFQNQINLYEISSQEQAIELYDMMREIFLVNKHTSILQEQLDGLYNVANIRSSEHFNKMARKIAIVALIIAAPSFLNDFSGFSEDWFKCIGGWVPILIIKFVIAIVALVYAFGGVQRIKRQWQEFKGYIGLGNRRHN